MRVSLIWIAIALCALWAISALAEDVVYRTEVRGCVFTTWPSGLKWGHEVKAGTPVEVTYGDTVVKTTTKTLYPPAAEEYYEILSPGWFEVGVPEGTKTVDIKVGGKVFRGMPTRPDVGGGAHFLVLDTGTVILDEATVQEAENQDSDPVMIVEDGQLVEADTEPEKVTKKRKWWPWSKKSEPTVKAGDIPIGM